MMGPELIRDISNVAAYRAAEEQRIPLSVWGPEDVRFAPFLGTYVPAGWREATWADLPAKPRAWAIPWSGAERALVMVDSSGFGSPDEPALTLPELEEYTSLLTSLRAHYGIGIVEVGQFQIVMAFYLSDPTSVGTPAPSEDEVRCPDCGTVHDGMEECEPCDDCGWVGAHDPEVEH